MYQSFQWLITSVQRTRSLLGPASKKIPVKKALLIFLVCKDPKSLQNLTNTTWRMQEASERIIQSKTVRMELIRKNAQGSCIDDCSGQWLACAQEVLQNNQVNPIIFPAAMRNLLRKRRGKFRNIMIVGQANCGKTFLLSLFQLIYKTFSNPANGNYAWLGSIKAEVIFLNDFRWGSEMISWKEMLPLPEGQTVHLPSPKNYYANDICISQDTPTFATGKSEITYLGRYNTIDETENEMMSVRWKIFKFHQQILEADQKRNVPLSKMFFRPSFYKKNCYLSLLVTTCGNLPVQSDKTLLLVALLIDTCH